MLIQLHHVSLNSDQKKSLGMYCTIFLEQTRAKFIARAKIRLVGIKASLACCNILLKVTNLSAGLYISQAGSSLKALLNRIPKLCLLLLLLAPLLDSYEGSLGPSSGS